MKIADENTVRGNNEDKSSSGGPLAEDEVFAVPLSFGQERLWMLDRLDPNTSVYNIPLLLRLRGQLNLPVLQHALNEIVRRHDGLRATFGQQDGTPVQIIPGPSPVPITVTDLSSAPLEQRESQAKALATREAATPFDLSRGPVFRVNLLKLSEDDHVLVLNVHHIVFDGWSTGILLRELGVLYEAFLLGKPSPLPELAIRYTDYAVWQRQYLSGKILEEKFSYWRKHLAGAPAHLELPTDHPRPPVQTFRGANHALLVPRPLLDAFKTLTQKEGATFFMTLLAAFNLLLSRYSGQEDIVVGTSIAGRKQAETEKLIGFFVNNLAIRTDLSGNPSFRDLIARMREATLGAFEHQDLPFEKLVEELRQERDLSRNPIFQVFFVLQNVPKETNELPGLSIAPFPGAEATTAKFELTLFAIERPDGLRLVFEYNTDLFEKATIERMGRHLHTLLQGIVADPSKPVAELPIFDDAERTQLLHGWNETREYPIETCIHQLFEEQVKRVPNNVALVFEGETMSYAELNARSNRVARYLNRRGVGPDVLVGLCMERSLDMIVGILGIVKAGGAYLPLDPRYPKDRLSFMVQDANPPVILTQYELKSLFPDFQGHLVAMDADWSEIEWEDASDLACGAGPDNLAYVIYTSGSTGRPKGCQITHANVVRLFHATQHWYGFDEHDVWTMFHSFAFDFSVWELWGALIYGGRLVVVPYMVSRSPEEFYRLLEREKVTVLNQTPSSFQQLIHTEEKLGTSGALALRYVIFGGEALDMQSLGPWFERHGDQHPQLVNMYGITETTVHVTYRPLSLLDTAAGSVIGCPIPDLQVYLLDRYLQPTPIGVPGEMYVGGAGVARGYLNRPELNSERFIPDTFQPGSNKRLYRSGDLARRLANGDIEYLGRIDQQVKIRGFRIELGEIESALTQHPAVKDAVVIVREDTPGDKRLVAYLISRGDPPSTDELRSQVKQNLPEYMVPSAFVMLASFPLTTNGKVDRRALPAPDIQALMDTSEFVAPRNPSEETLAAIWSEVLRVASVGVHDNFFELGGHSLLATQVIARVQKHWRRDVPLRTLFEHPTVAEFSGALEAAALDSAAPAESSIMPAARAAFRAKRPSV
jgi:amino acid adenylation domain-containing protein